MPQAERVAAPVPVTPSTLRNRLRSIPSVIALGLPLVVAHGAVATHFVLHVTPDAPSHAQRGDLIDLRHALDVAVTGTARLGAERLDVALVGEMHEAGHGVDADPLGRFPLAPGVADLLDLRLVRGCGTADQLMATDAGLQRGNPRLARHRHRGVAIQAGDLILAGVDVVTKEDRLTGTAEGRSSFVTTSTPARIRSPACIATP